MCVCVLYYVTPCILKFPDFFLYRTTYDRSCLANFSSQKSHIYYFDCILWGDCQKCLKFLEGDPRSDFFMSVPLSYKDTYSSIKESCEVNKSILDSIIKQCQSFIQANQNFLKALSKISLDFTDKRSSGIKKLSLSIKGPLEFKKSESTLKELLNSLVEKVFNNPPSLTTEINLFQVKFVEKLQEIKKNYELQTKNMIQMGDYCENMMKNSKVDLDKAMTKYYAQYKEFESVTKALKATDDPKVKAKQESLEKQVAELEKQCSEMQSNFNSMQTAWAQNMEDVLTKFELLDKNLNAQIADIFINFSPDVNEIKTEKENAVELLSKIVDEKKMNADVVEVLYPVEFKILEPVAVEPVIRPLSFDAAAYIGDEAFDGEDIRIVTSVIEDYEAQNPDEMTIKKNDLVVVHHSEENRHYVKNNTMGGFVPIYNLKAAHCAFMPHVMIMGQDYDGPPMIKAGYKVFVRNIIGTEAYILTNAFDEVVIPSDLLQE